MDAWWRTDPYQPMKRFFLTALLGLAAMMAVAAGFRTVRLAELARAVSLPTKAMEGSTDSIFFRNRPLRICYNQTGDIAHIGYKIFSDPQLEYAAPRPLLIYLERYLLETQIPHLNDRLVYAEEVKVREGKINMLFRVKDDTPIGVEEKQRKMYRITFGMTEGENLVLDVKCNSQFMLGADIVELERNMMRDLPRFPQTLTAEDWSAEATPRIADNLLICREAAFLDKDIRSDVYLTVDGKGKRSIYCNTKNPWRSTQNIFLTGETEMPVPVKAYVRCYEASADTLSISLQQLLGYCRQEGCRLYFGIKSQDDSLVHATLYALSNEMSFCHVVSAEIPTSFIQQIAQKSLTAPIACTIYPYVPLHYLDEKFFRIAD